jgi:hypothetical protein
MITVRSGSYSYHRPGHSADMPITMIASQSSIENLDTFVRKKKLGRADLSHQLLIN